MDTQFVETTPHYSRWMQDGAEYVRSNAEWCARCARALHALLPTVPLEVAFELAQEWGLDDTIRACSPELVAEDRHEDAATLEA